MSYILEALRKADQERSRGTVPGLDAAQVQSKVEAQAVRKTLHWGWIVAALVNVAVLGYLFWPASQGSHEDLAEQIAENQTSPEIIIDRSIEQSRSIDQSKEKTRQEVESLEESIDITRPKLVSVSPLPAEDEEWAEVDDRPLKPIPPEPATEQTVTVTSEAVDQSIRNTNKPGTVTFLQEEKSMQTQQIPPQSIPETSADNSQPPADSSQVMTEAPAEHENLPVWPQVPSSLFDQLQGNLRMDVHVYAAEPDNRFILVNLAKYHEGEQMNEGPVVEEITLEGVILNFNGERFLLPAQ